MWTLVSKKLNFLLLVCVSNDDTEFRQRIIEIRDKDVYVNVIEQE